MIKYWLSFPNSQGVDPGMGVGVGVGVGVGSTP